tara:strand:- start:87 stop:509 length:423 start_codon:yes stop_codon:yes gene_type:complete
MKLLTFTKLYLKNIFDFKGRASRWEYWGGNFLGGSLIVFISVFFYAFTNSSLFDFIIGILFLYLGFAGFSCSIRRLHDVGKSGWNIFWVIIPLIGALYLLFLDVQPSEQKNNRWGEVPIHSRTEVTQDEILDGEKPDTPF